MQTTAWKKVPVLNWNRSYDFCDASQGNEMLLQLSYEAVQGRQVARNLLNTNNFTMDSNSFMDLNRWMLFSRQFEVQKLKFEQSLKI